MLKFYIASVIITFIISVVCTYDIKKTLKADGYSTDNFKDSLTGYLYMLIPIWNIVLIFVMLFMQDEILARCKEKALKLTEQEE